MSENTQPTGTETPEILEITFADLGLAPEILRAIADQGYTRPTPIQAQAIPEVLAGRDIMGGAQTGTGKTAAFVLPLLQKILPFATSSPSPAKHPVRALILAPTRELAVQVHESVLAYSKHTPLRSLCAYGGVDIKPQIAELKKGIEILVATPGRLLDHIEQKTVSFNSVQFLILDEADRMLDMGFIPDIRRILGMLPTTRQSLLFSATFSEEIKKLADTMLRNPTLIEVARRNQVSETISHRVHPVSEYGKRGLLIRLLKSGDINQCIVFVKTKQGCSRLARELQRAGIHADAIHGDKSQLERMKALEDFKQGEIMVLVATDVAARGLDIDELPHVINYELPHTPEDYVHRIGRTGRAGKQGTAISLVCAQEVTYLVDIEKLIKRPIEQIEILGFEPEDHYEYPPGQRLKRTPPARVPLAEKPERSRPEKLSSRHTESGHSSSRHGKRNTIIAADGFDFSKPYEPRGEIPDSPQNPQKQTPLKQRRVVATLLGGLGRKD
jgi:ATP-dependent RNA helicase RhlE